MGGDWTDADAIAAVLEHVPHKFPNASVSNLVASRISGGVSNVNFFVRRCESLELGVVVRFRQKGAARTGLIVEFPEYLGNGKILEHDAIQAASAAQLAPELLHYEEDGVVMITAEVAGRPLTRTEMRDRDVLAKLLPAISKLHSLGIPENVMPAPTHKSGYRIMPVIRFHLEYMSRKSYMNLPEDLPRILSDLEKVDALIAGSSGGRHAGYTKICHTDLTPANILLCQNGSIVFVDFEYCSRSHPDYDVAKLASAAMFSEEEDATIHEMWTNCGGGFGDQGVPGSALARFKTFKLFEIVFRAIYCSIQAHESTLEFRAEWSDATTWQGAADLLWKELREKMTSSEMTMHRSKLARIRKCIVPAAGLASRIYPASKAISKILFPVYDPATGLLKPLVHHLVEEAFSAQIDQICFIVNPDDAAKVREYFDKPTNPHIYEATGRETHACVAADLQAMATRVSLVVQDDAEGIGDALMRARDFINGEPFVMLHGDHAFLATHGQPPMIAQLIEAFQNCCETTLGVGLEDEAVLMTTAAFRGSPVKGNGKLFKALEQKPYPILPETARACLRVEGVPENNYLVSFGAFVHMPLILRKIESISPSMPNARDGGGTLDAALKEVIREGDATLGLLDGRRLDIGTPEAFADTLSTLVEVGRKRRRT